MIDKVLDEVSELLSSLDKDKAFDKVKQSLKEMESIVENIETVYKTADKKHIEKKLLDLSYKQVSIYEFILEMNSITSKNAFDLIENNNESAFKIEFKKESKTEITTPFPPMKIGDFRSETSKIFASAIHGLLEYNLKEKGVNIPIYNKANVMFEVYIGNDMKGSPVPDADNLDLKNILDAMQNYLFPDDNLLTISYLIKGFQTEGNSYMKIVIEENVDSSF